MTKVTEMQKFKQNALRIDEIDGLKTHNDVYNKAIELQVLFFGAEQASIVLYKRLGPAKIISNKNATLETESFFANNFIWKNEADVYPTTIIPDLNKTHFINKEVTQFLFQLEIEAIMTIPLIIGNEVIGALASTYCSPNVFGENDTYVLERLAQKVAHKIEQLNLYERISRQKSFYETVFDHSFDALVAFDENGIVLDENNNFRKLLGLTEAENKGLNVSELLVNKNEWDSIIPSLESGTEIKEQQFLLETKDHQLLSTVINIKKMGYNTYLALIKDKTEELKKAHELKLMSTAICQAPFSIFITDFYGTITFANEQFYKTTGYTQEEIVGQNPRILKSGTVLKSVYKKLWASIMSGKEWRATIQNRRKDGTLYWSSNIITGIRNERNKITHYITFQADVTKMKKMQDEATSRLEELELFYDLTIGREGRMAELKERITYLEGKVADQLIERQQLKQQLRSK